MESSRFLNLLVSMVGLLCILTITVSRTAFGNSKVRCIESERQALLKFKEGLVDDTDLLSSWTKGDKECCRWRGVGCNNRTGHIIRLDLNPYTYNSYFPYSLYGDPYFCIFDTNSEIDSSLLELQYLIHLDLSCNGFTKIPEFIGSLSKLTYLNLSYNHLRGTIPDQLGNLSRLRSLDLEGFSSLTTDNLEWLSRLSSLRILRMDGTDFTKAINWHQSIKSHPSLSSLELSYCRFPEVDPLSLSNINSSQSLAFLVLRGSFLLPSTALPLLFTISSKLVYLDLSENQSKGPIPDSFGNMPSLEHLDLSYNQLKGPIPDFFENMPSLKHLDFSYNQLEGGIPKSLGNLCNIKTLILSGNNLSGLSPDLLQNLTGYANNSIEILRLSSNQLNGSLSDLTKFSSLKEVSLDGI